MNFKQKFFNTNLIYFIALVLFVVVRIVFSCIDFTSFMSESLVDVISTIVIQVGLMFLLPILMFSKLQKQKVKKTFVDFKYNTISPLGIVCAILIGACCFVLNMAIASFFNGIIGFFGYEQGAGASSSTTDYSLGQFFLSMLTVAVLPAICEENAHRGLLLHGYSQLGIKRAVIFSSLMFGLMHLNINQFFYATVLGFLIALSVLMSKSIIPAMIIHFMNNGLSTYLSFAEHNGWFGGNFYNFIQGITQSGNVISSFVFSFLLLIILIFSLVGLYIVLLKETRVKEMKKLFKQVAKINQENGAENPQMFAGDGYLQNLAMLNSMLRDYNVKNVGMETNVFSTAESKFHKPTFLDNVFFYGAIVLGGLVTVSTFIWGIL